MRDCSSSANNFGYEALHDIVGDSLKSYIMYLAIMSFDDDATREWEQHISQTSSEPMYESLKEYISHRMMRMSAKVQTKTQVQQTCSL